LSVTEEEGHNETDEPFATQPMMYGEIKAKNTVTELYYDKLDKSKSIDPEQFDKFKKDYRA
jgi:2-oxoglutarate dehydrogenase E1 component